MSNTPPNDFALIESVANCLPPKAQEDFKNLMQGHSAQLAAANTQLGIASGSNSKNMAAPAPAQLSVVGSNGAFNLKIANPSGPAPQTPWHEVSYSPTKTFKSNVTTLEPTTATSLTVNAPGETHFFRIRSSLNKQVWNDHVLASNTPASSGLVSSAATSDGGAFNQTNFMSVVSTSTGGSTQVNIQGAGGALTSGTAVKGGVETVLPSASVIGPALGNSVFAGWDGEKYSLQPTLAAILQDHLTPVGMTTVGSATPGGGGAAGGNGGRMTNV